MKVKIFARLLLNSMISSIQNINSKSFPLFGNLCRKQRSIDKDIDEAKHKHDELYVPDEPVHSLSFTVEDVNDFIRKSFENISHVKYQVNKPKVDELASSSVRYHKQKCEEVLNSVTENYLKSCSRSRKKILRNFN